MKRSKSRKIQVLIALIITIISGIFLWNLIDIPFGTSFNSVLIVFFISVVFLFFMLGISLLNSKRKLIKVTSIIPFLISPVMLLAIIILKTDYKIFYFQSLTPTPTVEEWAEDFEFLNQQMVKTHPDLFSLVNEDKFNAEFDNAIEKLPELSKAEILGEIFKLTALPNDAHTFPFIMFPCYDLHTYPIQVFYFDDGLGIVEAGRGYKDLIGSKILKIGSKTPEEIFENYPLLLSAESLQGKKQRFPYIVTMAEWLFYHKLIDESFTLNLTLKKGEEIKEISMEAIEFYPHFIWSSIFSIENQAPPVFTNPREDLYRFEFFDDSKTLYLQFNQCVPHEGKETMDEMVARMDKFLKKNEAERYIIDLRNNDGGEQMWHTLYEYLRDTETVNKKGKLYVLIGRRTFSSAVMFANLIQMNTDAIFIGEETSQGPVFYSGPTFVELPHSRLVVAVSTRKTITGLPFDNRESISPDIFVGYTLDDFNSGKDPVLDYALKINYAEKPKPYLTEEPKECTGRYLYNPLQIMDISYKNNNLYASFTDFIPEGLVGFQSFLYPDSNHMFTTKLEDVNVEFKNKTDSSFDMLSWYYHSDTINLKRAEPSYKTAFEYFSEDDYETGCKIIIENSETYKENIERLEIMMNLLGYSLMRKDQLESALSIFKLNIELYPESSNVYDSYGEALLQNEEKEKAIENYKKSVEINPNNENGKKVLKELGVNI